MKNLTGTPTEIGIRMGTGILSTQIRLTEPACDKKVETKTLKCKKTLQIHVQNRLTYHVPSSGHHYAITQVVLRVK